jgi:hypothetical protein
MLCVNIFWVTDNLQYFQANYGTAPKDTPNVSLIAFYSDSLQLQKGHTQTL